MGDVEPSSVEKIDIERDRGITLVFGDGLECFYGTDELRAACPCATCRGWREQGQDAWPREGSPVPARIEDAQLVGAWGLGILWNDGHSTGIYPFDSMREWALANDEQGGSAGDE